jgi:hypothetical protein
MLPIDDIEPAPDNPSWSAQLEEFRKLAETCLDTSEPETTAAAAIIVIHSDGTVSDDFIVHGDRAPLIAALRAMLASLES